MKDATILALRKLDKLQQAKALEALSRATQNAADAELQLNDAIEAVSAFDILINQRIQEGKMPASHFGMIDVQRQQLVDKVEEQRAYLSQMQAELEKAKEQKHESDKKHEIQSRIEDKWQAQKRSKYERKNQNEIDEVGARLFFDAQNKK